VPGSPLALWVSSGTVSRGMFRRKSERRKARTARDAPCEPAQLAAGRTASAHCARRHAPHQREVAGGRRGLGAAAPARPRTPHDRGAARGTRSGLGPVGVAPRVAHVNEQSRHARRRRSTCVRRACALATVGHCAQKPRAPKDSHNQTRIIMPCTHAAYTTTHGYSNTWFFPRGKAPRSCTATQHSALSRYAKLIMPHHGSYQACI